MSTESVARQPIRPLRVLFVSHASGQGGAPTSLRYLIHGFPKRAVEAHLICPDGPAVPLFKKAGVHVTIVPGISMLQSHVGAPLRGLRLLVTLRALWYLRHYRMIRKLVCKIRPHVVHLNDFGMFHVAKIARDQNIPVVMHTRCVADRSTPLLNRLMRFLTLHYVDRLIAVSQSVKWLLREIEHCDVIYNPLGPVNGNRGNGVSSRSPTSRPNGGKTRVTLLSNLMGYKGEWELLQSAKLLNNKENIVFQIAGGNFRSQEFHKSVIGKLTNAIGLTADIEGRLQRWLKGEGLQDRVTMLGHIDDTDGVLQDTDILVFPSHLNASGRSVFEAGAVGIPSIVSMETKFEDIVEDGVTGLIIPQRDPRALADAIVRLTDDVELREEMGRNARRKYLTQFDGGRVAQQVLDSYDQLICLRSRD